MGKAKVTYEQVRQLFDYNPETGWLKRRITTSSRARKGQIVGTENSDGYLVVNINHTVYYCHRIIWLWMMGDWPKQDIDHWNRIRRDNIWDNLRDVSRSDNLHNKELASGVYWAKRDKVWVASIQLDGNKKYLGSSKDRGIAETLYAEAKLKFTGIN